jgi:hypothetical protein
MKYSAGKFVQSAYDRDDRWGILIVTEWLKSFGSRFEIIEKEKEDYKVDLVAFDNEKGKTISFEVEVKHKYPFTSEESFRFDTVSFLGRKKKYGDFYYVIVCGETKSLLMAHSSVIYQEGYRELNKVSTNERSGLDEFYRVPKSKCKFYATTNP